MRPAEIRGRQPAAAAVDAGATTRPAGPEVPSAALTGPVEVVPHGLGAPGPVERQVALDMGRRALFVAPVVMGVGAAFWGMHGALSAGFGLALAVGNLLLAAVLLSWAARVSLAVMAAAALGGYVLRLGLLTAAVFAVRHQHWVAWVPLAFTLLVTHLGLLVWEMRYVSASLAYPALKPRPQKGP